MGKKRSEAQQSCSRLASSRSKAQHPPRWVTLRPRDTGKLLGSLEVFSFPGLAGGGKQGTEVPRTWQILATEHWPSQSCLPAGSGCSALPPSQSLQVVHASPHLDCYSLLSAKGFWRRNSTIIAWSAQDPPPPPCFELQRDHTLIPKGMSVSAWAFWGAKAPYQLSGRTKVPNSYMAGTQHSLSKPWQFDMSALAKEKHRISLYLSTSCL